MSHKIKKSKKFGRVRINYQISDIDGINLFEGISVESLDNEFEDFEIQGISTEEFLKDLDLYIELHGL